MNERSIGGVRVRNTVILAGARTPFGKLGGALRNFTAMDLAGQVIRHICIKFPILQEQIAEVVMGMVLQGGMGQNPARQAAHLGGLSWSIPAETINKVCASGLRSVTIADQIIRTSGADVIIAGGMESMSQAPYLLTQSRFGQRLGHGRIMDSLIQDGLWCAFADVHMIQHANQLAKEQNVTRTEQDNWAWQSHQRALKAMKTGYFQNEMVVLEDVQLEEIDESVRPKTTLQKLSELKPVIDDTGVITAGNAPGINDGACVMLLSSSTKAAQLQLDVQGVIVDHCKVAGKPRDFPIAPLWAIKKLLQKTGYATKDIDLWEINEAFALVPLIIMKELEISEDKVNIYGGAVAMGHPIGASGARIVLTLIRALQARGGGMGIAAICSGGGQGDAVLVRVDKGVGS